MIASLRKYAYMISAIAVACFFLFPDPDLAVIGALLLQTLAFIVIAGKSTADGIALTGITLMLIGLLPDDHPMIREPYFIEIKLWILVSGVVVLIIGLLLMLGRIRRGN